MLDVVIYSQRACGWTPRVCRGQGRRTRGWLLALGMLVLAGCASPPASVVVPGRSGGAVPARPAPGKDGPPLDAPADLINTPDPEPKVEPIKSGGPNKPYTVLGQSYAPVVADVPWKQRGLASWYGQKFQGRRTASGEIFSAFGVTAAHRTLPIPSYARVRHVASGREIIVRVNDRGPFHSARVLDLSYAAALKLGIVSTGSAEVEIERLTFDDIRTGAWRRGAPPLPADDAVDPLLALVVPTAQGEPPAATLKESSRAYTPTAQGFWVQLAVLSKREGIEKLQQRVSSELASLAPLMAVFNESRLFRLQVGPYESREQALGVARAVREVLAVTPVVVERR
ncbi:MAG: septal ring lytic transglycosylase RlpA family protein [Pseudomonadota bacterium]